MRTPTLGHRYPSSWLQAFKRVQARRTASGRAWRTNQDLGRRFLLVSLDHLPSNQDRVSRAADSKASRRYIFGDKTPEASNSQVIFRLHHTQRKRPRHRRDGIAASPRRRTMRLHNTGGLAWKESGDASLQTLPHSCGTAPACAMMAITGLHPFPSAHRSEQRQPMSARASSWTSSARDVHRLDKHKTANDSFDLIYKEYITALPLCQEIRLINLCAVPQVALPNPDPQQSPSR